MKIFDLCQSMALEYKINEMHRKLINFYLDLFYSLNDVASFNLEISCGKAARRT